MWLYFCELISLSQTVMLLVLFVHHTLSRYWLIYNKIIDPINVVNTYNRRTYLPTSSVLAAPLVIAKGQPYSPAEGSYKYNLAN